MSSKNIKIAVPCDSPGGLSAQVNSRFGRCSNFTIITLNDKEIGEVVIISNSGNSAMGGAGPVAAQAIAKENVQIIAGGNYGPNAANALQRANIAMYGTSVGTVKELIDKYLQGTLPLISNSNVSSHTGIN